MGRIIVVPLFCEEGEPPAILKCDFSDKFYSVEFNSWKDAVHFLIYLRKYEEHHDWFDMKIYNRWADKYYDFDEEEFTGDYNEFRDTEDFGTIFISTGLVVDNTTDLKSISIRTK
jgi:hypothetical protein